MEKKEIRVYVQDKVYKNGERSIPLTEGMSLYHALIQAGIQISAPCAGKGSCGACKIQVLEGYLEITSRDKEQLSKEQLDDGFRLACQAYPKNSCTIYVPAQELMALTDYQTEDEHLHMEGAEKETYAVAIDLGTTTIAYELFAVKNVGVHRTFASTNPQRIYGADVITRMEQSNGGRRDLLKHILRQGMKKDLAFLLENIDMKKVQSVAISGNTAMVHLFMGYSCEELSRYPFTPVTLEEIETDALTLQLMSEPVPVYITAGISAYVGGDILAGIASLKLLSKKEPCLFLDLGTNAEMALFDGHGKIYVTSAPAGPAFEAANISCGVGSVEGAVSGISIQQKGQIVHTIGGKEPIGFCGSGILEAVYELLNNGLIDETGLLTDRYFETGYPIGSLKITQQDIRHIQLAKSAVFSAICILLKKAQIEPSDINTVFLAGGFGFYLNVEKAIGIGMLPKAFEKKVQIVGNASLYGTKEIQRHRIVPKELSDVKSACEEIYLSNECEFQTVFMENMNFNAENMGI